jgi:peptide/nickel transport system substrate-binding protein
MDRIMPPASRVLLLGILILSVGCAPAATQQPSQSQSGQTVSQRPAAAVKRIVAGIPANPPMLYNKLNVGGVGGQGAAIQDLVHVGLTAYDPQHDLQPRLAEAVPTLENGLWQLLPDGKMDTIWHIRPNAVWHDGTPFTADDLAFTLRVAMDRELPAFGNVAYASIETFAARDPRTFVVRWSKPFVAADSLFNADLATPLPRHLLEREYAENKAGLTELAYWGPEFVGTGPFKVREFERGSHLLVEAFEQYALGRPKIDLVEVRFVVDETTLVANLLADAIELTLARAVSAEQGVQLRNEWKNGRMELTQEDWYVMYPQFMNPNPATIADVRLRRALISGTDRQQMAETLEGGLSGISEAIVHPKESEYREVEPSIIRYPYDPRRSVQLIEELGYTRGPDAIYRDAAGQRLQIEVNATRLDAHQKLDLTLADEWPRIGVAVEPNIIPPQRAQDAEYRATFPGFALQGHPRNVDWFHSKEARVAENGYRGRNNARYANPELDVLIDRYLSTVPKPERTRILAQIAHHMSDQLVTIPLIWRVDPTMIGNRLVNVGARGADATQAWNAHEWDVKS